MRGLFFNACNAETGTVASTAFKKVKDRVTMACVLANTELNSVVVAVLYNVITTDSVVSVLAPMTVIGSVVSVMRQKASMIQNVGLALRIIDIFAHVSVGKS